MGIGTSLLTAPLLASDISVGEHPEVKVLGLTVNVDIVWATVIAGLVVVAMGMILRARATSGVPGKFQLIWEMAVGAVQKQVSDSIGPRGAKVVPLALTLFVFIFTCNLFEVLGIGSRFEFLPAPTSDINLPLAMALFVIVLVHRAAIKNRGVRVLSCGLDEVPGVYKDIRKVMDQQSDLVDIVARFDPKLVKMSDDGKNED